MNSSQQYHCNLSQYSAFPSTGVYVYEGTSTESSPSPISLISHLDPTGYESYSEGLHAYHGYSAATAAPLVEFTDLTAPYNEDRRKRRPHATKDKQTISSMHMRRRAQNRASQRAFRDRKEKHAQDLQRQLDELEAKHRELLVSYRNLDSTNTKLSTELEALRAKIANLHSSRTDALEEMMASEIFDNIEFDHGTEGEVNTTSSP